jgi:hypothetical protein
MSSEQDSLIVKLARQCSESSRLLFERLGEDLDCKMGAALAAIRDRRRLRVSLPQQSSTRVDDEGKPSVASVFPEPKAAPLVSEDQP